MVSACATYNRLLGCDDIGDFTNQPQTAHAEAYLHQAPRQSDGNYALSMALPARSGPPSSPAGASHGAAAVVRRVAPLPA